jgi:hypothetical protein
MKAAVDAQIVQFEAQGSCCDEICAHLLAGPNRISRVLCFFRDNNTLPCIPPRGGPKKVTPEILDFIDVRTLQSARLFLAGLSSEVRSRFGTAVSGSTVSRVSLSADASDEPPRLIYTSEESWWFIYRSERTVGQLFTRATECHFFFYTSAKIR